MAVVGGGAATLMAQPDDHVVAWVNGEAITKDELYQEMVRYVGPQALEELILARLVRQEALAQGVTVDSDEIAGELAAIEEQAGGPEQLAAALAGYNMTVEDLKEQIALNLTVRSLVAGGIEVTDDEVRSYFDENRERLGQPEQVRARHILVKTREEAEELRDQILAGADFAEVARAHSTDPGSAAQGGDLGWFGRGQMVQPFEEAAFALEPGELSEPVETAYGYHLILVEDRQDAQEAIFDDGMRASIREMLFEQKLSQRIPEWLNELRSGAEVEILLETEH